MTREERNVRQLERKEKVEQLWKTRIPDLQLSPEELLRLKQELGTWALHVQEELLTKGLSAVVDRWERLIFGLENQYCEHGGKIRRGEEYLQCCGLDYEYVNDLYCRSEIETISVLVPQSEFEKFRKRIEILDERFKKVPKDNEWVVNSAGAEKYAANGYWWFHGFPEVLKR